MEREEPSRSSSSAIAIEYTSSPVEQPATQIRIGAPSGLSFRMAGRICDASASNTAGSLKNEVT